MSTNSRTWFYTEPEHRPYYIQERVNQTLWANRLGNIYLECVRAESPFRLEGKWNDIKLTIEWEVNNWFRLTADKEDRTLIAAFSQVLQFPPSYSYNDENGVFNAEWWRKDGDKKYIEIKGHPNYSNIKTYKR